MEVYDYTGRQHKRPERPQRQQRPRNRSKQVGGTVGIEPWLMNPTQPVGIEPWLQQPVVAPAPLIAPISTAPIAAVGAGATGWRARLAELDRRNRTMRTPGSRVTSPVSPVSAVTSSSPVPLGYSGGPGAIGVGAYAPSIANPGWVRARSG